MSLDDAIGKALEQTQTEQTPPSEGQTETQTTPEATSNESTNQTGIEGQTVTQPEPSSIEGAKAPTNKPVWDGDISKLPPELQEHAKAVTRYTKQKEAEAADYRKKIAELEARTAQAPAQPQTPVNQAAWTPQEWEEAQLDPTGTKMAELVNRQIEKAKQDAMGVVSEIQREQNTAKVMKQIQDFAAAHPDFEEMHNAGIMRPIFEKVVVHGGGTLEQAYEEAKKITAYYEQKALQAAQGRVAEKKAAAAVVSTSTTATPTVVKAKNGEDALDRAASLAWEKKQIKVTTKG